MVYALPGLEFNGKHMQKQTFGLALWQKRWEAME